MKKILFYIILTTVSLTLIILDIVRPFLGFIRLLGYLNLILLAFSYYIYDEIHFTLIAGTIASFAIFYGYHSIIEFFNGVKYGMLNAQSK